MAEQDSDLLPIYETKVLSGDCINRTLGVEEHLAGTMMHSEGGAGAKCQLAQACPLVPHFFRTQVQDAPATGIEERKKSFLNSPRFGFHPVLSLLMISC